MRLPYGIHQKSVKNPLHRLQDASRTLPRPPGTRQDTPRTRQDTPRTPPGRAQDAPKTAPEASKTPQKSGTHLNFRVLNMKSRLDLLRTPILGDFCSIFDGFFDRFFVFCLKVFWLAYYIDY